MKTETDITPQIKAIPKKEGAIEVKNKQPDVATSNVVKTDVVKISPEAVELQLNNPVIEPRTGGNGKNPPLMMRAYTGGNGTNPPKH